MFHAKLGLGKLITLITLLIFFPLTASALLTDEETSSLADVFKVYQKSKSPRELLQSLKPWLSHETYAFLHEKAKKLRVLKPMPKLHIHSGSRVSIKYKNTSVTVDFISLHSGLIAINGREVEFLPDDKIAVRWKKVMSALGRRSASHNVLWPLLEPVASAANEAASDADYNSGGAIMEQLAFLISAANEAAKQKTENQWCVVKNNGVANMTLLNSCNARLNELSESYNDFHEISDFGRSLGLGGPPPEKKECPKNLAELSPEDVTKYDGDKPVDYLDQASSVTYSRNNLKKISKDKTELRNRVQAHLQALFSHYQKFKPNPDEPNERKCQAKIQDCLTKLMAKVAERTTDPDVACYAKHIERKIQSGAATGKAPSAEKPR